MGLLKVLVVTALAVALLAAGLILFGPPELSEHLADALLLMQTHLPVGLTVDHILLAVTVTSVLFTAMIMSVCSSIVMGLSTRLVLARQHRARELTDAKRRAEETSADARKGQEYLVHLQSVLVKRLDKQALCQAIVEGASRSLSVPQANSIVSLWLLQFGEDTLSFDTGIYCDQGMFIKPAFQLAEAPFSKVMQNKKPVAIAAGDGSPFIKPDKQSRFGAATSMLVIPMVLEETVLGVLAACCHPAAVTRYQEQPGLHEALWGQLALALAIAIQGELAIIDRLTGAYHREYFRKRLIQELDRANRYQLPLAVMMVDIDNFKAVNDMLGHPQGDAVLKIVAKLIKKETRAIDLFARYGGEEFIILLPDTGAGQGGEGGGAMIVAERLRHAVEEEFSGMQKPLNITISIGVVVRRFPEEREWGYQDLVRVADEQLYRAKTSGKNRVCVNTVAAPAA